MRDCVLAAWAIACASFSPIKLVNKSLISCIFLFKTSDIIFGEGSVALDRVLLFVAKPALKLAKAVFESIGAAIMNLVPS